MNTTGMYLCPARVVWTWPLTNAYAAGSLLLVGAKVPRDSFTVQKLRAAGAIILGKTNMSEWANYRSRKVSNGWSADAGQCLGAYHDNQDPIGSSSGSGVAADLGLAFATLGTETDASIIAPAQRNGVVGIKPTVGLTSRDLVIPICEHQDSVGPMARTVKDAAVVLQSIVGKDPKDKYTLEIPDIPDYVAACDADSLQGARIGVPYKLIADAEAHKLLVECEEFNKSLEMLKGSGATLIECELTANKGEMREAEFQVYNADLIPNMAAYLSQLTHNPSNIHSLADIRDMTQKHEKEAYPERNTAFWDEALDEQGWDNSDSRFDEVYKRLQEMGGTQGLLGALQRDTLDAVVMPSTMAPKWAAIVGAPIITVPLGHYPPDAEVVLEGGLVDKGPGIPFGISFLGGKWDEARLIGLAYAFEQKSRVRERKATRVIEPMAEVDVKVAE